MDDFVIWGTSREELKTNWQRCRDFLIAELHLHLKRQPAIRPTSGGMNFLGCRVFHTHVELNRRSRRRFRSRLKDLEKLHACGKIGDSELQERATALVAFTRSGSVRSWNFRHQALSNNTVSGQEPRTA